MQIKSSKEKPLAKRRKAHAKAQASASRQRLARAISEILHNEHTAPRLLQDVGNFVTDISTPLLDDSPAMIEKALALGQCGYTTCPGTRNGRVCSGPNAHPPDKEGGSNAS